MKKNALWLVLSSLIAMTVLVTSCSPAVTEEEEAGVSAEEEVVSEEGTVTVEPGPPGYEYSDYYPIILSITDNYGNVLKKAKWNNWEGPKESYITGKTLHPGDEIYLTVETWDPRGRTVLHSWMSNAVHADQEIRYEGSIRKWSTSNELTYVIHEEDLQRTSVAEDFRITVWVKVEKERYRDPKMFYDDHIKVGYTLAP